VTPRSEQVIESILYLLWDLGLKVGHAVRSVDDCMRQAKADMTIRTNLLEKRFLSGDRELFQELWQRYQKALQGGTGIDFIDAKLAERDRRHERLGGSRYARGACATCTPCSGSRNTSTGSTISPSWCRAACSPAAKCCASRKRKTTSGRCAVFCIT
jgi:hypothetical protein